MTRLRLVTEGERAPRDWFGAEAKRLLGSVLAKEPTAIVILYETAKGVHRASVPRSDALAAGMIDAAFVAMYPPEPGE